MFSNLKWNNNICPWAEIQAFSAYLARQLSVLSLQERPTLLCSVVAPASALLCSVLFEVALLPPLPILQGASCYKFHRTQTARAVGRSVPTELALLLCMPGRRGSGAVDRPLQPRKINYALLMMVPSSSHVTAAHNFQATKREACSSFRPIG